MNAAPSVLALALDFPTASQALRMAEKVRGRVPWVKVGLELFSAEGPSVVHALKDLGFAVFLDLKLHDIPHTVHGAVLAAARLGADMITLHTVGGERMVRAAVNAVIGKPHRPLLFGVTILTSTAPGELFGSRARSSRALAKAAATLALRAQAWGMDGVVCSGHELRAIRRATGLRCLTPGIRLDAQTQNPHEDQRRTVSPAAAVRAGAEFLVVGRPVTAAPDPVRAVEDIIRDMRSAYPTPRTL